MILNIGPANKVGPRGEIGPQGPEGLPGVDGRRGSLWFSGATLPDNSFGLDQDLFFDITTNDLYQKINGAWEWISNLKGKKGDKGKDGKAGEPGKKLIYGAFGISGSGENPTPTPSTESAKLVETFDTDSGTSVRDLCYLSSTDFVSKVSNNTELLIPNGIFGIIIEKPSSIRAKVLFAGIIDGYSGFSPGRPLFISPTGTPTHTPPLTGVVQQIGFAVRAGSFMVQLMIPIIRIAP